MTARLPASLAVVGGASVACLGDSITACTDRSLSPNTPWPYPSWLSYLTGQRVDNFGLAGDTLSQMAARLDAVIAAAPSTVVILGGANDLGTATPAATSRAAVQTITARLLAAGIRPVWCTVMPRASSLYLTECVAHNMWLVDHCRTYGLKLIDTFGVFADTTGNPKAGLLVDGLHPTDAGYKLLADTVYAALGSPARVEDWFAGRGTLNSNPDFNTDSNADGLADGWTVNTGSGVTQVNSLAAHPTQGKWQKLTRSGSTDITKAAGIYSDLFTGSYSAGDTLAVSIDVQTNANLQGGYVSVRCQPRDGANAIISTVNIIDAQFLPLTSTVRLRGEFVVPANTGRVRTYLLLYAASATATDASFGRLSIRKKGA